MTEIEQLLESAIRTLDENFVLSAYEKAQICGRLQDMAYQAQGVFMAQYERDLDRRIKESDARTGYMEDVA